MPNWSDATGGAVTGAELGSEFGPEGTAVGAVAGGLLGAFTESDADKRKDLINNLIKQRQQARQEALARLSYTTQNEMGEVNKATAGRTAQSNANIGRRAAGSGRKADQADYLSSEGRIASQGSQALQNIQDANMTESDTINNAADQQILGDQALQASLPMQPSVLQTLETAAGPAIQYLQNQDYIKALGTRTPQPVSPDAGGIAYDPGSAAANTPGANYYPSRRNIPYGRVPNYSYGY